MTIVTTVTLACKITCLGTCSTFSDTDYENNLGRMDARALIFHYIIVKHLSLISDKHGA